jgi:hypothetical protein
MSICKTNKKKMSFSSFLQVSIIGTLVAAHCSAAPIYLSCSYTADSNPSIVQFEVKLDEENASVTHSRSGGAAFNAQGFFSSSEVKYQESTQISDQIMATEQFVINRATLRLTRNWLLEVTGQFAGRIPPSSPIVNGGVCELKKVSSNRF